MAQAGEKPAGKKRGGDRFWPWTPRFWSGMNAPAWFSLLARNRCAVSPSRWLLALNISVSSLANSLFAGIQGLRYGRRIRAARLPQDPIFILGHWRSGTTLLHELLVLDRRFTFPDNYAAFGPDHFLVSAWFFKPLLWLLVPRQRPMDNMLFAWHLPQEDEFALCNMGARSPYLSTAFPNRPLQDRDYLDLANLPPAALDRWKRCLLRFLKSLTVQEAKPIVLKSPPHTARIRVLLEMFPQAKFVHIVRDPQVLFASTCNLWRRLFETQGMQKPNFEGIEENVFETFERMYAAYDRDRPLIPPGQFAEVRYEDLVARPMDEMRRIYEELGLGGFDEAAPQLAAYFAEKADYQTNRYQLSPELADEVRRRWGWFAARYGYAPPAE